MKPFYEEEKKVRYTDMAIWIDQNAHKEDCDDEKLFSYLYSLLMMLAIKNKYFKTNEEYTDFGIFSATKMYFLYLSKRKKMLTQEDIEENPYKYRIKGCLNYLKSTLQIFKINFHKESVEHYVSKKEREKMEEEQESYIFSEQLMQIVDEIALCDFKLYMDDIPKTIRNFMHKIPIEKNSYEWDNIYMSVILSLLNQLTIDEEVKKDMYQRGRVKGRKLTYQDETFSKMRDNPIILYHLDESKMNYITTLVREVKHLIAGDLSQMSDIYVPSDSGMAIEIENQLMGDDDNGYSCTRD